APPHEDAQRRALAQLSAWHSGDVLVVPAESLSHVRTQLVTDCWATIATCKTGVASNDGATDTANRLPSISGSGPRFVAGEPWTEEAFAALATAQEPFAQIVLRVRRLRSEDGDIVCE